MKRSTILTLFTLVFCVCGYAQNESFDVSVTGKGQPVIFLPGFTCPGEVWDNTVSNLEGNYTNYLFTYAGFGDVPAIEIPWYETLVSDISDYIATNNLTNVILIGHSMGGMVAIDIAANHPQRIAKMIMVDALPCIRELIMPDYSADQIVFDNPYNRQMIAASDSVMRVTAGYMAQGMSNMTDKHSQLVSWIMESDRETYVYGYTELLKLDLREKLNDLTAETLILGADFPTKEAVTETFESQYANLKNKEIRIAVNSKHFIMYDQPEWFYQEVNSFLK